MSKHKGIRFCDKCMTAIPVGDAYYEYSDYKFDKCSKCTAKSTFKKLCVGAVLLAFTLVSGYATYDKLEARVRSNKVKIEITAEYVKEFELKVSKMFVSVARWADTVETRISNFYQKHEDEALMLQRSLDNINKQTLDIRAAHAKLLSDLTTGKMTDEKIASAISVLQIQQKETEQQLQIIMRNPQEIINKIIKPTVGVAVKSTKDERLRGSGVLYKRVKIIDPVTKNITYRYYGFTCYHVWQGVFKYYEDIKKPDEEPVVLPDGRIITPKQIDRTLNPKLVIYYYGGDSRSVHKKISAEFLHPTQYIEEFIPQADIAVFTFVTTDGNIAVAELASNDEIKKNVYYGSRMYTTGIAMGGTPSLYFGTTGNPALPGDTGILFQAFGYYGQSGGPIFDARTLKVISINQRVHIHPVLGGMDYTPLTNTIFGTLLTDLRSSWEAIAKGEHKKLLD